MTGQRYLVTARKYRPQVFGELVAQEHVTETLKNAIRLDRLAHAYLFSGPRGVGKTTAARILAKAINCTGSESEAEPCRSCESCRSFEEGRSLNIIEIDAASNNKVDDVRDLRETVRIPPQGARKKVYIVDEVHMLSTQAFNALLKTLEEPPPYVLFIFATTQPHKVLPTILSRCQRFDFRRISVPEIVTTLTAISEQEAITADEASLLLIARKGDGALRDALSVFDQAVSLCGADLRYAELARALGVVDVDLYFEVSDHIAARNTAGMLHLVERIVRSGHDLQEFLAGLAEHLRNLLVARTMRDDVLIEATSATRQRYTQTANAFSEVDLLRLLTIVAGAEDSIRSSTQPRLKLEIALLKMASISVAADLREALGKIERLEVLAREGNLSSGGRHLASPPSSQPPKSAVVRSDSMPHAGLPAAERPSDEKGSGGPSTASAEPNMRPAGGRSGPPAGSDVRPAGGSPGSPPDPDVTPAGGNPGRPAAEPDVTPPSVPSISSAEPNAELDSGGSALAATPPSAGTSDAPADVFGKPALKRRRPAEPGTEPVATGVATAVAGGSDDGPIERVWDTLLQYVKEDKIQIWSLLHHTRPETYRDGTVVIAVPNAFHERILSSRAEYVVERLRALAGVPVRSVRFVIQEGMEVPGAEETASDFDPYEYMQRKRQENPVIRAIFDQFGGELVW